MEVIPEIQTIPVESVTVDHTNLTLTMTETETATLNATVLPADATDPTVTWSSDNEEVATVENGVVTAHKSGTANITAKAGDKEATCVVNVSDKVSYSFTLTPAQKEINYGETLTYVAKLITTTNGTDVETEPAVTLTSSEEGVVTIDGLTVTGAKGGTTTISAFFTPKGTEEALTATATLTVKDVVTYALKISPTTDDQPVVIIGNTLPITLALVTTTNDVEAEPDDITADADWSISGDAATLTDNKVTGVKEGKVTITAKYTPDGSSEELSVSVELKVNKDPNHAGDPTHVEGEEQL
ncbi:MAG: Ig-like domain-containing protein [Bacteroidales bacterium]|nr:Ig-like domain-containing protein [Bacteroidales bacterium]